MKDWGVLDKDGQWIECNISENRARFIWNRHPFKWRLVKNIQTDEEIGSQNYEIVEEV